jgi:hypothetical protein
VAALVADGEVMGGGERRRTLGMDGEIGRRRARAALGADGEVGGGSGR